MDFLDLAVQPHPQGCVALPGSKSISNRSLLLAALAQGKTDIDALLDSDDTRVMLTALVALGVNIECHGQGQHYTVHGVAGVFPVKHADLFLGNAGTAFRPLTAALALSGGEYRLSGVPRMHERPIGDLVDALRALGCVIDYLGTPGFPPLALHAAHVPLATQLQVRGDVSSQFLTALLMALPLTGQAHSIEVLGELISKPYIDITINLMARFGVHVTRDATGRYQVPAARYVSPGTLQIEGDASSASYFLAAGAIGGGPVRVTGVGRDSIQGDIRFVEALASMGAQISMGDDWLEVRASTPLHGIDADMNPIPDAAMALALVALFAEGSTTLRNIASWRVKETDRLAAMAIELRKLGAEVEEGADFIRITPPAQLIPHAQIDTYDDHRMAMCFALASLAVPVRINDPACVNKTFPHYFAALVSLSA